MSAAVETMFSGRGITPWHKLGTIVEGTPTSADAIRLAGLDWSVEKHKVFARIPTGTKPDGTPTGVFAPAANTYATVRMTDRKVLGIVTARYEVVQNHDLFATLDTLVQDGVATYETAGSLDGGARVWMLMHAPDFDIAGDRLRPYFMASASHDGSGAIYIRNVTTRVVCANTLAAAMHETVSRGVTIRHTASAQSRLDDAAKVLGMVRKTQAAFVSTADQLLAQPFSRANFERLVAAVMPPPDPSSPLTTDRMAKSWQNKFEEVMRAYSRTDLENVRSTAWGAFNAIADYEQHDLRAKGGPLERAETAFKRAFETNPLATAAFARLTTV
jgi:phage/plasmid-like protein (TIGR03299 family)